MATDDEIMAGRNVLRASKEWLASYAQAMETGQRTDKDRALRALANLEAELGRFPMQRDGK